jgi:hypothetical protein
MITGGEVQLPCTGELSKRMEREFYRGTDALIRIVLDPVVRRTHRSRWALVETTRHSEPFTPKQPELSCERLQVRFR